MSRDHGGNLDAAAARYGGAIADWIDLSTGINRVPYPLPDLPLDAWCALPRATDVARLVEAARAAYRTKAQIVPLAGAQAAIQGVPGLVPVGRARVLSPTYNEHAACLRQQGWEVTPVATPEALAGADLAVVVTPNNPDGRVAPPDQLLALSERVGALVVDESFADATPDTSLAPYLCEAPETVLVLRSFGKFYGLAGLRLGFALARAPLADRIRAQAGPWPISGPAIEIGVRALCDESWQQQTVQRLLVDCAGMDALAERAGWSLVGGTALFRTYATSDAAQAQAGLARARIWSRIFPYSRGWIRLGLPAPEEQAAVAEGFAAL